MHSSKWLAESSTHPHAPPPNHLSFAPARQLLQTTQVLNKFETLQVQRKSIRELLDAHPPRRLRVRRTDVTVEFVLVAQRLGLGELPEARRYRGVVRDLQAQVEEVLISRCDRLAAQTPRFVHCRALEDIVDPGAVLLVSIGLRAVAALLHLRRR